MNEYKKQLGKMMDSEETSKDRLLKYIQELPSDLQWFVDDKNGYGCVDLKIFKEKKGKEFINWYFGV